MFRTFKEKTKHHLNRQLLQGAKDIDSTDLYCEFGVYRWGTINFIASRIGKAAHKYDSQIAGLLS